MAEHRASVLSASLRRYEDPVRSRDPRIRRLVAELRTLEPAPAPRAHFRAELRAQLVAVAPRLVAEGVTVERPATAASRPAATATQLTRPGRLSRTVAVLDRLSSINIARPVAVITAVVAVFALLLGSAVWVSKKSLPGDPLYALKRANEDVKLSLTTGDTARGKQYLSFASIRAEEVAGLLKRASAVAAGSGATAGGAISAHTANLVTSTLDDADADVRNAAQLLSAQAVQSKSAQPLTIMTNWAPAQESQLQTIAARIPAGALHDRAAASGQLVMDALGRSAMLQGMLGCSCLSSAPVDELGPLPCTVCASAPAQLPSLPAPNAPTGTAGVTQTPGVTLPGITAGGAASSTGTSSGVPPASSSGGSSLPGGVGTLPITIPPITLPSLPIPTPTHSPTCVLNVLGICIKI